jgi:hypothetical protein
MEKHAREQAEAAQRHSEMMRMNREKHAAQLEAQRRAKQERNTGKTK